MQLEKKVTNEYAIGTVHKNNQGCEFMIVGRVLNVIRVKFLDEFGYEYNVSATSVYRGSVINPYVITVYGKGYYGDIVNLNVHQKEKKRWNDLLKSKMQYPPHWNCLELFVKDLRAMDVEDYEKWLNDESKKIKLLAILENGVIVGFEVSDKKVPAAKKIIVKCMHNGEIQEYDSMLEASIDTGYCMDTIRKYCTLQMIVDGFQFSFK